ncbi:peptidase MA family metallohydrolase [Hymenobacter cellulosilyticus]|uniref:Peptidase MA-like domain-containing protein n=1 Tax=Hymenobacter cellulosilyticus TaxID=2932248 RepID=A0A8T9QAC5_9BACT|nr:hypothetical protein [Hymenobacter cellulosilyticus]UOQ74457.1 hypothetical protein MUN79_11595 [Hymenobacter cellulosilyticus]
MNSEKKSVRRLLPFFLVAGILLLTRSSLAQQGFPQYYEYLNLTQKADSLKRARQYPQAASFYGRAARVKIEKGIPIPPTESQYQAAQAWSQANKADSAFHYLSVLARQGFAQADTLRRDIHFNGLHADARWMPVLARVDGNAARERRLAQVYRERTEFKRPGDEVVFNPPPAYVRQFIYNDTLALTSVNYANFRLFFRGNSYSATHLPALKDQLASAWPRILSVLQVPAYQKGVYLTLVDSKQELKELTGLSPAGGFALVGQDAAFLVNSPTRRLQAKHEIFHLLANEVWGVCQSRLLNEGGAVFCDNECWYENPIYSLNAYFLQTGKLLPLSGLINDFDNVARTNQVVAYLQSAALFKYLYEQYGVNRMKQLWRSGFGSFQAIYGFSLSRLEKEWKAYIRKNAPPKAMDWDKVSKEGCG